MLQYLFASIQRNKAIKHNKMNPKSNFLINLEQGLNTNESLWHAVPLNRSKVGGQPFQHHFTKLNEIKNLMWSVLWTHAPINFFQFSG